MSKDNRTIAKRLLSITAILFAAAWATLILSAILMALVRNSSAIFILTTNIGIIVFAMPLPCLILAIVGTVFANKTDEKKFKYIGIAEILISACWIFLTIIPFYFGQGI